MIHFQLDGIGAKAKLGIGWQYQAWSNYHVTKHIVADFNDENFIGLIDLSPAEVEKLRKDQHNNHNCLLDKDSPSASVCRSCESVKGCWKTLTSVRSKYEAEITRILINDCKKPRHAHCHKGQKIRENLIIVDDSGLRITLLERKSHYNVATCFRHKPWDLSQTDLSYTMVKVDKRYYYKQAIKDCHWKFNNDYNRVTKHELENWIP